MEHKRSGGLRSIGDREVSAVGYGALQLSVEGRPEEPESLAMLGAVLDAGVTLIDTADSYCVDLTEVGHNERLIRRALDEWSGDRGQILVATKGGHYRPGDGTWPVDGRPSALRSACEGSLRALGVDVIDLYQLHRPDPVVPFCESVGALRDLRGAGMIRMVGISNVTSDQITEAHQIVEISSVQN
jgi:aryl-alcohol dehydrogenase-like predicted oxidoreductase